MAFVCLNRYKNNKLCNILHYVKHNNEQVTCVFKNPILLGAAHPLNFFSTHEKLALVPMCLTVQRIRTLRIMSCTTIPQTRSVTGINNVVY